MTPLLARLALVLVGIFSAAVGVIGAAPADPAPLREWFLPDECPAPCVLGLHIGEDTLRTTLARLEPERSIEAQIQYRLGSTRRYQLVNWGGYLFYPFQRGGLLDMAPTPDAEAAVVDLLFIRPATPPTIGAVYLSLGPPERLAYGYWYHDLGTRASLILHWYYADERVTILTRHLCPVSREAFWQTPILSARYSSQRADELPEILLQDAMSRRDCRSG